MTTRQRMLTSMSDVSILLRIYVWERVWMKRLLCISHNLIPNQ